MKERNEKKLNEEMIKRQKKEQININFIYNEYD